MNSADATPSNAAGSVDASAPSDAELVQRSQRGDTAAFEELVTRYRERVFGLAYGLARNEHDAQDLCQEAFIRAWRSIGRFRGQSSVYTWLYRITTNLTIDMVRRRSRAKMVEFDDGVGRDPERERRGVELVGGTVPSDEAFRSDQRAAIERAMEQLTPDHRAVVLLKDFEGLEYKEIAQVVGCSPGTVMSRLFYARRHLQRLLKDVL